MIEQKAHEPDTPKVQFITNNQIIMNKVLKLFFGKMGIVSRLQVFINLEVTRLSINP